MKTYQATVTRGQRFWLVRVPQISRSTQARHLRELDEMTKDLIHVMTDEDLDSFEIEFDIQVPEPAATHLRLAQELTDVAAAAQAKAAAEKRLAARELAEQGLPTRDIGKLLGISHQRAHQLLAVESTPRLTAEHRLIADVAALYRRREASTEATVDPGDISRRRTHRSSDGANAW